MMVLLNFWLSQLPSWSGPPARADHFLLLFSLNSSNKQKGKKLGELLLVDALQRALNTSMQVASLAVIAEALDEDAMSFYLKYGFQPFRQNPMKLYLPMKSIEDLP
jgi:hypothetical protein